uniref:Putative secreted protein n=1 Tax=Anopheles marajoara TaxID=58244 RepID=A0A2M4C9Q2_9DIPT
MMAFFTSVLVRISSLLDALYTTSMIRHLRAIPSEAQAKFPASRRRARNFLFPPRVRTRCTRVAPILVLAAGRPNSYFLFLRMAAFLPPVARLL